MNRLSRRSVLKSTGAAIAPFLLPSRLWSAETKPGEKITMGFIGMGKQNRGLLNGFLGDRSVQVVAVCEVDQTRREAAKAQVDRKYGNSACATYNLFTELVARDDLDAVCIATPDHWHAIQCVAALDHGKDVYCEKPLTHNIHESVTVIEAVKRNKRILQTGSMQRSSREFRVACELVRNGVIGKVERGAVNIGGPGVPCDLPEEAMEPGLDWDLWLGPAPVRPYNSILSPRGNHDHFPAWRNYREYGGGMITDWGAHHIDIIQWGLGMDESGPIGALPPEDPNATTGARLLYAGDITVEHGGGIGVQFVGADGEVQVTRGGFFLKRDGKFIAGNAGEEGKGRDLNKDLDLVEREFLKEANVRLYRSPGHLPDFLNSVRSRKAPITPEVVGARSGAACHLMNLAYYHREPIQWDPARFQFTGGTGNPQWLTRDYRGEWRV